MQLFTFTRDGEDVVDEKSGKVKSHKTVHVCAETVLVARAKSKLNEEYHLVKVDELSKDWS